MMNQELQISLAGIFGLLIIMAIATGTFPQKTTPKCKRIGCNREADESTKNDMITTVDMRREWMTQWKKPIMNTERNGKLWQED